jgi:hypothetical protein
MTLTLTALAALPVAALETRDRMSAADFGIGGFPFNISASDYYAQVLAPPQLATAALLLMIWIFLSGGIIDRLARDRRSSSDRFFAACGACFGPLIRLGLLSLLVYASLLRWVEPWFASMLRSDELSEIPRLALFGALALLLFFTAIVFDYARLRLVIEDRRSAVGALRASLRMLRAHGLKMIGVQAAFWMLLVIWIFVGALPGADVPGLGWVRIAGELLLKLALIGAQASLYQSHLAAAGWVARQDPSWPDEPSANPAAI